MKAGVEHFEGSAARGKEGFGTHYVPTCGNFDRMSDST